MQTSRVSLLCVIARSFMLTLWAAQIPSSLIGRNQTPRLTSGQAQPIGANLGEKFLITSSNQAPATASFLHPL